ncbi:ABC transporter permease [Pseudomarimonas salicorniae]|uniref:ABC transporter permease n=1 Tax=Pseudomarimonas salicorniae TaxID=2933270 RepID=A0ABT0GG75_9GAMM|nr:ABC transporter permease [Lysobacter sp. CAU 1642]MCK7593538.1 ABC transporter permease [Lysobacter sp. CAU 1642]
MTSLIKDFAYALRGWSSQPVVAVVAALSLALGLGVNAAIFSLYEQVMLRPLPVEQPHQLVNFSAPGPKPGSTSNNDAGPREHILSLPMLRDLAASPAPLEGVAGHRGIDVGLGFAGESQPGEGLLVSGQYFELLRLAPQAGRLIGPADDSGAGDARIVVLSDRFWRERLGGDPGVLGQTLRVNGQPLEIVGIAPPGFHGTTLTSPTDVFLPIGLRWALLPQQRNDREDRNSYWVYAFGRLPEGVEAAHAEAALNTLYQRLVREVELPALSFGDAGQREAFAAKTLQLLPGFQGQSSITARAGTGLSMLWAIAGLVLLIACLNVANLLLARGVARSGELALRASIGASRGRLLRQLFAESLALALLGGLASLPVAAATLGLMARLLPNTATASLDLALNLPVVGFALLLALCSTLLFGLLPAWRQSRVPPMQALRQGDSRGGSRFATRFRQTLATAQIALSMASLVLAGLFAQSLYNLQRAEPGLDIEAVASFSVAPRRNGYGAEQADAFYSRLEERLAAVPGALSVTSSMVPLLSGSDWGTNVEVEGRERERGDDHSYYNEIGLNFFDTLGVRLLAGRDFAASDTGERPRVAIVNQRFAEKFGLGREAVGKRMGLGSGNVELDIEIVGIVAGSSYDSIRDQGKEQFFLPRRQTGGHPQMLFYVRAAQAPEALLQSLRAAVAELDPQLPVENLETLSQRVRQSTAMERVLSLFTGSFAVLATLLAAVGLYGVVSYGLNQRLREFGLRLALGAPPERLRRMVFAQVGRMATIGLLLGLGAALAAARSAESLLFGLSAHDPRVVFGALAVLLAAALGAALVPARRAGRIDPMQALRHD